QSRCSTRSRTGSPMQYRERRPEAAAATGAAGASLLLLVQRHFVGDAVGKLLQEVVELRAREVRDLDLDVLNLRARRDAPAFDLAEQVERRGSARRAQLPHSRGRAAPENAGALRRRD